MNKKFILLPVVLIGLAACSRGSTSTDQTIKVLASKGSSTLVFAGMMTSSSFNVAKSNNEIASAFQNGSSDVIVCNAYDGLKALAASEKPAYKLTSLVTGDNYVLVKLFDTVGTLPSASDKILAFNRGGAQDVTLTKTLTAKLGSAPQMTYATSASEVYKLINESGNDINGATYAVVSQLDMYYLNSGEFPKVAFVSDINNLWEEYTTSLGANKKQPFAPGDAIFVSNSAVENKSNGLKSFYNKVNTGKKVGTEDIATVKTILDSYGSKEQQRSFLGFDSDCVEQLQSSNLFNVYVPEDTDPSLVNYLKEFAANLGDTTDYSGLIAEATNAAE